MGLNDRRHGVVVCVTIDPLTPPTTRNWGEELRTELAKHGLTVRWEEHGRPTNSRVLHVQVWLIQCQMGLRFFSPDGTSLGVTKTTDHNWAAACRAIRRHARKI
jgi:hypothetical protein